MDILQVDDLTSGQLGIFECIVNEYHSIDDQFLLDNDISREEANNVRVDGSSIIFPANFMIVADMKCRLIDRVVDREVQRFNEGCKDDPHAARQRPNREYRDAENLWLDIWEAFQDYLAQGELITFNGVQYEPLTK